MLEPMLSFRARLVLAALVRHTNADGVAHLGYRRIARLTGVNKNALRSVIDELEHAGSIQVLRRGNGGSLYRVRGYAPTRDRGYAPTDVPGLVRTSSFRSRAAAAAGDLLFAMAVVGARLNRGVGALRDRGLLRPALLVLLVLGGVIAELVWIQSGSLLYLIYIGISLLLGTIAWTTLVWMMDAWRTPDSLSKSGMRAIDLDPAHSFSLIVPARHEETVLEATLSRLVTSDHPDFEVLVVVGADDHGTRAVAEGVAERHPELVRVIVDPSWPKNKPRALNAALPHCTGEITGVFDAEDVVHPQLLRRVDQRFQRTDADVVQSGVQLMNFRSSWLTVRNVLEYYFWFRSRLHVHARQGFIPLGGNTVFIRTQVLKAVSGWDPDCLAEDCELGVRLSALGARTVVVYEPGLVTREECPPTLRAFARQRTRWNQGYLQTLSRGYWRGLPRRQRVLGAYILTMPYLMGLAWLMIPVALATALALKAPVPITLISFAPALPILSILAMELAGLGQFCRLYGERASARDYGRLVLGLPLYQGVLAFTAARAIVREARGARGWEKTAHAGLHFAKQADHAGERVGEARLLPSRPARRFEPAAATGSATGTLVLERTRPVTVGQAGSNGSNGLPASNGKGPLWMRLDGVSANGSGSLSLPAVRPVGFPDGGARLVRGALARLTAFARSHSDLVVLVPLLVAVGFVQVTNMTHWPGTLFDEGTYVGNAWAVQERGALGFYTYTYGHPPLAWLLITVWTWAGGVLGGRTIYSVDAARGLMAVINIASCALLYTLARRLELGRSFAAGAVILFALCPLGLFFHRGVLLDNPAVAFALAAFVLALTPRRGLWAFAASGAFFAASVLSKETTLVLLPALVLAAAQNSDKRTRRYCLTLLVSFLTLMALAYPLYAALKGELLPGPGHVSLVGSVLDMLFRRQGTGSIFDPHSVAHGTVTFWLRLDPWLLGGALLLSPLALALRDLRAIAVAFLIQIAVILRPGYLPAMYVIALLPFAALIVAGSAQAMWRHAAGRPSRRDPPFRLAAAVSSVMALLALLVVAALYVAPHWARADREALTVKLDGPQRAAERWLVDHVGHEQRLIVTDDYWIYLIEHGFDSQPVKGGFNSRTVVSYWPLDYDPAVKKLFPDGWRDFDYIVSTQPMRDTAIYTPSTAQALDHSRVVAQFGEGDPRIEIRAIMPSSPGT